MLSNDFESLRGRITEHAPLGSSGWFRCGGAVDLLFKPADEQDLCDFLKIYDGDVQAFGVLSNVIVRDGGLNGAAIRLGRSFTEIERLDGTTLKIGAGALDGNAAQMAAQEGIGGLEFLAAIPGTLGGALRMNAGAYGTELKDILVEAHAIDRQGNKHVLVPQDMEMSYRHTNVPEDYIFTSCIVQGVQDSSANIEARIAELKAKKEETQPLRERTGGSTFANPSMQELEEAGLSADTKAWKLIDQVGGRGLSVGGAQMSEKHCNFMINCGTATSEDLENLGEILRNRVYKETGITLRWEIKRIGQKEKETDHGKIND